MKRLSAEQIIPPYLQAQLMARGQRTDEDAWWFGDVTNELVEELVPETVADWDYKGVDPLKVSDIWRAVGQYSGRSPDTVRGYARVSKGVLQGLRDEYDMLFRSHHVAILDYSKGDQGKHAELCDEVLEWGDDYGGTLPSVSVTRDKLERKYGEGDPLWVRWAGSLVSTAEKLQGNDDAPADVKRIAGTFIREIRFTSYRLYLKAEDRETVDSRQNSPETPPRALSGSGAAVPRGQR